MKRSLTTSIIAGIFLGMSLADGAVVLWDGDVDTDYLTPDNWDSNALPDLTGADDAVIGGEAIYTPGGDMFVTNGSTLTIGTGGSWTQTGGVAWIQAAGGTIAVNAGGSFNMGTAGNMIRNASTSLNIGGSFTYNSDFFTINPTETGAVNLLSGGSLIVSGELKPLTLFSVPSGASLTTGGLISFSDGPGIVELAGGSLEVQNGGAFGGFYGTGADRYVDVVSPASAIIIGAIDEATALNQINSGAVRYNGLIDPSAFEVTDLGGGSFQISAVSAVPEPSTYALFAGIFALAALRLRRKQR